MRDKDRYYLEMVKAFNEAQEIVENHGDLVDDGTIFEGGGEQQLIPQVALMLYQSRISDNSIKTQQYGDHYFY